MIFVSLGYINFPLGGEKGSLWTEYNKIKSCTENAN